MKYIITFFIMVIFFDPIPTPDKTVIIENEIIYGSTLPSHWKLCSETNVHPYPSDAAPIYDTLPAGTIVRIREKSRANAGWMLIGVNPAQWINGKNFCPRGE